MSVPALPGFLEEASLRLLLFGGKGGVGKTTCAMAAAWHLARTRPDEPFLLVSTDPAHSLQDALGETTLPANLRVLEWEAQEETERFFSQHSADLRDLMARGTLLGEAEQEQLLRLSLPGLEEWLAFLALARYACSGEFACVVADTAPTGHVLRLLSAPETLQQWLNALDSLLAKDRFLRSRFAHGQGISPGERFLHAAQETLTEARTLLEDAARSRFVPVTLAESLPLVETKDLLSELSRRRVSVREVVLNRLFPENNCSVCHAAREAQTRSLLREADWRTVHQLWEVPYFPDSIRAEQFAHFWSLAHPAMPQDGEKRGSMPLPMVTQSLPLPEASLFLFAGKGGVGKTTLACATALHLAQRDRQKRVLLFSSDPAHSLSDALQCGLGQAPTPICANLDGIELDSSRTFDTLKREYARELEAFFARSLSHIELVYDSEALTRLFDLAPPGLDEVVALMEIAHCLAEGQYDTLVLDTAPTGHFLRLLTMPDTLDSWLKFLFALLLRYRGEARLPRLSARLIRLSRDLKRWRARVTDRKQTALSIVTVPTHMALEETCDLVAQCTQHQVPVRSLWLNQKTLPQETCAFCSTLSACHDEMEAAYRRAFAMLPLGIVTRGEEPTGIERLSALGAQLYTTV